MTALEALPTRRQRLRSSLSPAEWRRAQWMFGSIILLHALGFGIFIAFVVPGHYKGLGFGVSILAYTLGARHAFDADHISAIDNTTRKLMADGKRPLGTGFFFALGHSSTIMVVGAGLAIAAKAVFGAVVDPSSSYETLGGVIGTSMAAIFLYLIAAL